MALSRSARGDEFSVLPITLISPRPRRRRILGRRLMMALATLGLGMSLFALFFGLVAACDRL
ncbi:MAG TPA: hypothetical protein VKP69_08955 [Isosphaeraceae bacterium]|nr:hypothetical protein [Isosphaeraceae bacterium]